MPHRLANPFAASDKSAPPRAKTIPNVKPPAASPTSSSCSSVSSLFDSPNLDTPAYSRMCSTEDVWRNSQESTTSWGSVEEPKDRAAKATLPLSLSSTKDLPQSVLRFAALEPRSVEDSAQPQPRTKDASPDSIACARFKEEDTPRGEIPAGWIMSPSPDKVKNRIQDGVEQIREGRSRTPTLKRDGSWRKKTASLDNTPHIPKVASYFPGAAPHHPLASNPASQTKHSLANIDTKSLPKPHPPSSAVSAPVPEHRRFSAGSAQSASPYRVVAKSSTTGCFISAPISPPAHYPMPLPPSDPSRPSPRPASSAASTSSSSSSGKGGASSKPKPPAPRWAQPPAQSSSVSGRAASFGSAMDQPDADFDPELFEGIPEGEWIEIIKGMEGRIAIKATPAEYEVMVWLPGFSVENIVIATRGSHTLLLMADQWDEGGKPSVPAVALSVKLNFAGDHAQWDIKLGEDADTKKVSAQFSGDELRVKVARIDLRFANRARSLKSSYSDNSYQPSITATVGHARHPADAAPSRHTGSMAATNAGWDEAREKREIEAKMGGGFGWGQSTAKASAKEETK
ncbi:hypothetical protein P7C73_g406, partial [Tremellales sp. Uapishka_1]